MKATNNSTTLFKKDSRGRLQQWIIEVVGNRLRTIEGLKNGSLTTTEWTECFGKNKGSKKETSDEEQAFKEAEARVTKQKKKGYCATEEEALNYVATVKPMLAHKYEDYSDRIFTSQVAVQPKLDGIRCLAKKDGALYSREGNRIVAAPHIEEEVKLLLANAPEDFVLDGELYNHELKHDFNTITSIVKKQKLTPQDFQKSVSLIQYHIYDCIQPKLKFSERYSILKRKLGSSTAQECKSLHLVDTRFLVESSKYEADKWYESFLTKGYEGAMYRSVNQEYVGSRTPFLLKRKEWIEEEFKLIDILVGRGNKSTMAASVVCVDNKGEQFDAGIIGNNEYCTKLLEDKENIIGKMVTVKYQNLTPDRKVPRFAKMKTVRDYE